MPETSLFLPIFPGKKHPSSLVFSAEKKIQNLNLIYLSKIPHLSLQAFESTKDPKP